MSKEALLAKDKHSERARGLAAAIGSYQMGVISIDRVLRNYSDVEIGAYWHELAEQVVESIITSEKAPSGISKLVN
jgi:hypothetical protein